MSRVAFSFIDSHFGRVLVADDGIGICAALFSSSSSNKDLKCRYPHAELVEERIPHIDQVSLLLKDWKGDVPTSLPLSISSGTEFQRRVWSTLREIPLGETWTYGELAHRVHCRSAQAVGVACGANPLAVLIPCHRVVYSDGDMSSYAMGTEMKHRLLQLEGIDVNTDNKVVKKPRAPFIEDKENQVTEFIAVA